MTKRVRWLIPLLVAALLGAACGDDGDGGGSDEAQEVERGGTFTVSLPGTYDSFDPIKTPASGKITSSMVFDFLVGVDLKGQPDKTTGLAEDWSYGPGNTTLTFTLRDAKWSDGTPVTSTDVKFSLERMMSPASINSWASIFRTGVSSVEATDPKHVKLNLTKPDPLLHYHLTRLDGQEGIVIPKAAFEANPNGFAKAPVGSGPYKLTSTSTAEVVFDVNRDYWRGLPRYDRIVFKNVNEESTRVNQLRAGETDFIDLPRALASSLQKDGFNIVTAPVASHVEIWLTNQWDGVFADKRVREAVNLAIDRETIIQKIFAGRAEMPNFYPMTTLAIGYTGPAKLPYDPAKAKDLIRQAGAEGKKVTLNYYPLAGVGEASEMLQAVASYLQAVGLQAEITTVDWLTGMYARMTSKDPTLVNNVGWMRTAPLKFPAPGMRLLDVSNGPLTVHRDPTLDKFVVDMEAATSEKAYGDLVAAATKYIADNHLRHPIAEVQQLYAANAKKVPKGYDMGKYTSDTYLHGLLFPE